MAFVNLTCQSVSAKIGYNQIITPTYIGNWSPLKNWPGAFKSGIEEIRTTDDGTWGWARYAGDNIYVHNNWLPYLTLADCEEYCRASSTCVNAMYEYDVPAWAPPMVGPNLHGTCFLNSGLPGTNGLPKVFPKMDPGETSQATSSNQVATRMTITKSDKGMFD